MNAIEYLPMAIKAAVGERVRDKVFAGRFPNEEAAKGPSVVWREEYEQNIGTIDLDVLNASGSVFFEIECHSSNPKDQAAAHMGACAIANDILRQLQRDGAVTHVLSRYDEAPDRGQQEGQYFSHVIAVGLRNRGLTVRRAR